jgi:hypothetical protein
MSECQVLTDVISVCESSYLSGAGSHAPWIRLCSCRCSDVCYWRAGRWRHWDRCDGSRHLEAAGKSHCSSRLDTGIWPRPPWPNMCRGRCTHSWLTLVVHKYTWTRFIISWRYIGHWRQQQNNVLFCCCHQWRIYSNIVCKWGSLTILLPF